MFNMDPQSEIKSINWIKGSIGDYSRYYNIVFATLWSTYNLIEHICTYQNDALD